MVSVTGFECIETKSGKSDKSKKKGGKSRKKMEPACRIELDGGTITIVDSGKVGTLIKWTVESTDTSGNATTVDCGTEVVKPQKKSKKSKETRQ